MNRVQIKLIVLDVDGTLIRGDTLCQLMARRIDKLERMNWFEQHAGRTRESLIAAREEMAGWYIEAGRDVVSEGLSDVRWAPNVVDVIKKIGAADIELAIASVTWGFAVAEIASSLGVSEFRATELDWDSGEIGHMFPQSKAEYLSAIATRYGIPLSQTLAVGDSSGDIPMLTLAGAGLYVGESDPQIENVEHHPNMDFTILRKLVLGQ